MPTPKPRKFIKATIQDVADHAGVSTTTVSHFISGNKRACSPDTAERIRGAIEALHYAPTMRFSRHKPTKAIGVCAESVANFDERTDQRYSYMERVWSAIIREADVAGYTLLHYPAEIRHGTSADAFLNGSIDGLLFSAPIQDERVGVLIDAGLPTVLLNRFTSLPRGFAAVCFDEKATVDLALSHLWGLGHRRIVHLAGPIGLPLKGYESVIDASEIAIVQPRSSVNPLNVAFSDPATRRCTAYLDWMAAHGASDYAAVGLGRSWLGASVDPTEENWFVQNIDRVVAGWLLRDSAPTAVLCGNDDLAFAVIAAARRLGRRVPEDLSVVGIDNRIAAIESDPPLTSVDIPAERLGREAMRMLVHLLRGDEDTSPPDRIIMVPTTQLVIRASTAPPH